MLSDKAIVLCILHILKRYSDSEHILSVSDIIAKLRTDYALEVSDRRTVYKAIDMLTDPYLGYEISKYNENGKGYYFVKDGMDFEPEQIQMISDAVCAFPFISLEATKEICDKLQGQLSVHEQNVIKRLSVIDSDRKTANKEPFLNVDVLDKAISRKVKVQFDYYRYDIDKKQHKRREKKYTVNPYGLIYCNEHYYLACIICSGSEMGLYRVDLMKNVTLTEYKIDDPNREFSYKDELKKAVNGFLGEQLAIKMLVDKREIGHVIDKFGTDLRIKEYDGERCCISLKAAKIGFIFWAVQFLEYVEVVEPQSVREEIIEYLKKNKYGV